jgi:UDP-glucose 4-epimerase
VIDDLSTGSRAHVEHLRGDSRFRCVIDSCANGPLMAELVDACDGIFHLAAAVGVKLVVEARVRTIETNSRLTDAVLALASRQRKPVLIASTSEVYGKSDQIPFREDSDLVMGSPDRGRWSYACSKALNEFLAIAYWKERQLPTIVVRLFNTVGPRQTGKYGMVVPTFVRQGLAGRDLTIFGDGSQSRCFTHVADTVEALIGLMRGGRHFGQVYNVGGTSEITMLELARQVQALTGHRSRLVFIPYDQAYAPGFEDLARRVPDVAKIGEAIGWKPTRDLQRILTDVIEYFGAG